MLPAAIYIKKKTGCKVIYDSHELETHRNIARTYLDRMFCMFLEAVFIRQADAVVTVCDSIADHLARTYKIGRPSVVMNAPNTDTVSDGGRDIRTDLDLDPSVPLAIYVGKITVGRGLEQTIQAIARIPRFHLALLGGINAVMLEQVSRIAADADVTERVHIMAPVPPDMVVSYIRGADASLVVIQNVCLSYYYCLPNKLIESAMAGVPVVASAFPELERFVSLSGAGLVVDETDPAAIAEALVTIARTRDDFVVDHEHAERIKAVYGWPTQRDKLIHLYRRLLGSDRASNLPEVSRHEALITS